MERSSLSPVAEFKKQILYVSAYYHIPKRKMPHMGIGRYVRLMPESLKMISGSRLVFYYEEDFIGTLVTRLCENYNIELSLVRREIAQLPRRREAQLIAACADDKEPQAKSVGREKGLGHFRGMILNDDRSEYEDNLTIWLSKIDLVMESCARIPSDVTGVAWMDIGIAKFNYLRRNWRFNAVQPVDEAMQHYSSPMRLRGEKLPLNASFLQAAPDKWSDVSEAYAVALGDVCGDSYPHDEETVLAVVVRQNPEFFRCVGDHYSGRSGKLRYILERLRAPQARSF